MVGHSVGSCRHCPCDKSFIFGAWEHRSTQKLLCMSLLAATLPTQQDLRGPGHWLLEAEHHCLVYIPQSMHARTHVCIHTRTVPTHLQGFIQTYAIRWVWGFGINQTSDPRSISPDSFTGKGLSKQHFRMSSQKPPRGQ